MLAGSADLLLLMIAAFNVYIVSTSRLTACVRASAAQGVVLAILPLALWQPVGAGPLIHLAGMCVGALVIKAVVIPILLFRAIRQANVHREVEPFVSLHLSILVSAALVVISFWIARLLVLPVPPPSALVVPVSFATLLIGFFILVSRRKAVNQVVGYLMIENGVFVFAQTLASAVPFMVELGVLLDLLAGVLVMGIAIFQISREFDHIDADRLETLKG